MTLYDTKIIIILLDLHKSSKKFLKGSTYFKHFQIFNTESDVLDHKNFVTREIDDNSRLTNNISPVCNNKTDFVSNIPSEEIYTVRTISTISKHVC